MMRKLLLTIICCAAGSMTYAQVISSFPYMEDFEGQGQGPTGCGPTFTTVGNTWQNGNDPLLALPLVATHQTDWTSDVGGTSSGGTGPSVDHTLGNNTGHYMYCETSCSGTGFPTREFDLVSPYMDFTALTAPSISFWRHQLGVTQGTLHLDATQGSTGIWANDIIPATTDNLDLWQETTASLIALAGLDSVRLRIRYISGTNFEGDVAIDDISVFQPADVDFEAASVDSIPGTGCGLGLMDVWTTLNQIGSVGLIPGDTLFVNYSDGTTTIMDTVVLLAPIGPGGVYNHMFSQQADYTVTGTYNITVSVYNDQDPNNGNDTTYAVVNSIPVINTFPYSEDFESGNGGWVVGGITTFELAAPSNVIINSAASDSMAYVTNATGIYNPGEDGYVEGPCFDLSTLDSTDVLSLDVWWNAENSWDGANITTSIDGGATWTLFGSFGEPNNWYTDNTINGTPGGFQEGWTGRNSTGNGSGGWVKAHHAIGSNLSGQSSVLMRVNFGSDGSVQDEGFAFDNIQIGTPVPLDTTTADAIVCGDFTTYYGSVGTYEYASQDTATFIVTEIDTTLSGVMVFNNPGMTDSTFNLIVRFTDYLGCVTIDTAQLTLVPAPDATIEGDTTICFGGTAAFTVASGINYEYLWSDMSMMDSAWFNVGGMIGVTVMDTMSGCSATDSSLVSVATVVDIPATANVCGGDSLIVDAGTYDTYLWSTTETTQTITITTPGTYTVTAMDTAVGCTSMDSIVITTSLPVPAITGVVDTICANSSMVLDAGAGFSSYSWTTSGSAQTETILGTSLPLGNNTVTVTVTDGNGCSNTDAVTFNIDGCAGLDDLNAIAMSIYPNPSTGEFMYSIENMTGDINMMVTDLSGKIVDAGKITTSTGVIDLSNFENGIYILKLQAGNNITSVRLLKM
jgi:hypothetical protein